MSCEDAIPDQLEPFPAVETVFVSAVVLIDADRRILLAQRPQGKDMAGLWEFPGGKIEEGEAPEVALVRELHEELGIRTAPCCFSAVSFVSHAYEDFHLLMPVFACRVWKGIPKGMEEQNLKWVRADDLDSYPMPEADRPLIPIIRAIV